MDLTKPLAFLDLIYRFQRVERRIRRRGEDRLENDAEHSYQLAMAAWHLNAADQLGMDTASLVRFALVHDIAEVYAGDTPAFTRDDDERASKETREEAALDRIASEFPEFPELVATVREYELRASREARFVYALDKLLPIMANYLDDGRTWHLEGVTLDEVKRYKTDKIAESPEVQRYYAELVALLEEKPDLFPAGPANS